MDIPYIRGLRSFGRADQSATAASFSFQATCVILWCLITVVHLFAQDPLEQFIDALVNNHPAEMRSIVVAYERQLGNSFFQILKLAAEKVDTNRDEASRYLLVAAALSRTFADARGDMLYDALKDGSSLL